ncbi:hypothetical protein ACMFMG_000507 [Clarireedia jacksonii]
MTGGFGRPQAIILISFDPAIELDSLKRWGGMGRKGVGEGPHIEGRASGYGEQTNADNQAVGRIIGIDRKGKGKQTYSSIVESPADVHTYTSYTSRSLPAVFNSTSAATDARKSFQRGHNSWILMEKAMYRDIELGFYFGLERSGYLHHFNFSFCT